MKLRLFAALLCLGACTAQTTPVVSTPGAESAVGDANFTSDAEAFAAFSEVVSRVAPVAESLCRARTRQTNCDFQIVVDTRRRARPNAFQSLNDDGRPVLTFTASLITDMQNADELAFVVGHEAAHHIRGHIARQKQEAAAGAEVFAELAAKTGGSAADVESAQELGAVVGAFNYTKEFEYEADALGALIAQRAGYDPLRGAAYFARIPDPGNDFLSTHPPNAERLKNVRKTVATF